MQRLPHEASPKNPNLAAVSLATLNADRHSILASLKVRPAQEDWGGTFAASMKEWEQADREFVLGLAFLKGDEPVGIVLLKRKPFSPDWVSEDSVSLHGLKIAESYQGQGFGQAAFELTIQAAMSRWPMASQLVLAVDAGNEPALAVYRSFGMVDSGPVFKGRIGFEHRLRLKLDFNRLGDKSAIGTRNE